MEKEYKAKKWIFVILLFSTGFFIAFAAATVYAMLIFPRDVLFLLIIFLLSSLTGCLGIAWQLATRFHTVRISPDYLTIRNERYYFDYIFVSPIREMLVKHRVSFVPVHEEYQYFFHIAVKQGQAKLKKFHFTSKYYKGFDDLYDDIRKKAKPLAG